MLAFREAARSGDSLQRRRAAEAAPGLARDATPGRAFREELPSERSGAPEPGVNTMRDRRRGGDPDEPPQGGRRRQALAALRFAEVAQSLGAIPLPEGRPADDQLPCPAQSGDFGIRSSSRVEQFFELVQQIA